MLRLFEPWEHILVQADRRRRPKAVIHVLCVLRALQRTQNTQNVYKRTICGAAATCTGLLPLQFRKALHFQKAKGVLFITGIMGKR